MNSLNKHAFLFFLFCFHSLSFSKDEVVDSESDKSKQQDIVPMSMEDEEFKNVEIRVIRPKYFKKKNKIELGLKIGSVTNETWSNSYPISASIGFHFNNYIEIESRGAYFFYSNSKEKKDLDNQNIETIIPNIHNEYSLDFIWTPLYGKFQLKKMNIFYFDMFLNAYYGAKSLNFTVTCQDESVKNNVKYPNYGWGFGQRFFMNTKSSIRWSMRYDFYNIDTRDQECKISSLGNENRILVPVLSNTFEFGYSYFL